MKDRSLISPFIDQTTNESSNKTIKYTNKINYFR